MTAAKKPITMCCVSIGHRDYLMPAEKGMKLVELLQSAFECDERFEDRGMVYEVGNQPEHISLKIVRPNQIRQPRPAASPGPRALPAPGARVTLDSMGE